MMLQRCYAALAIVLSLIAISLPVCCPAVEARANKIAFRMKNPGNKQVSAHKKWTASYFIPPPPAYMPSVLPELVVSKTTYSSQNKHQENPYKKYFYSINNHELPQPLEERSGVTVWSRQYPSLSSL